MAVAGKWMRTHALLVQKERSSALSVFQSVCAMFVVGNETMLREMLVRVPILIAAGASERDLVKILSTDKKIADALAPLVVALRQLAGESVRASAEVHEVAADVRKDIEAAIQRGANRAVPPHYSQKCKVFDFGKTKSGCSLPIRCCGRCDYLDGQAFRCGADVPWRGILGNERWPTGRP